MIPEEEEHKELGSWFVTASLEETLGNMSERNPEFPKFSGSLAHETS